MANTPKEPPKSFIDALNEQEAAKKQEQDKEAQLHAINKAGIKNVEATNRTTQAVTKGAADIKAGVKVTNPDLAKTQDVDQVVDAVHKLNLTTFNTNQGLPQLADNLVKLTEAVQTLQKDYETKGVAGLSKQLTALVDKLDGVSKVLNNSKVEVDSGLQKTIDSLQKSIDAIDFNPSVNVKAPAVKVVTTPVDLSSVEDGLRAVVESIEKQEAPETDLTPVISGLSDVQNAITSLRFPVPNYVLPFKDINGEAVQAQLDSNGKLPISGTITVDTTGLATSANQTNGSQLAQIVDAGGEAVTVTGGKLDVNATISGAGGGTSSIDKANFAVGTDTGTPSMGFYQNTLDTLTTGKVGVVGMTAKRGMMVNLQTAAGAEAGVAASPLQVSLANTAANTTAVKVDGSAVTQPVSGTFWQATQPVSGTVTANAGTNLNTSLLALESGGNLASIKTDVDNLNLAQGSTTLGQSGNLVLSATTTAAPTYTTAKSNPLSTTTSGALRVDLGATSANATAIKVDGSAVTQPVSLASTTITGTVTVSGSVTANAGTNLNTSLLALESGGNLASIKTDVDNLNLTQGSTTSGQKGNLILGAVTTTAPTYTTAQSNPLSLTTGGALRVDASAATVPVSGTFWQATQPVSGTVTTTPPSNASTNISQINGVTPLMGAGNGGTGSLRVNIASDQVSIPVAATLSAETTKVVGTVRTADGSGNLFTSNSTTFTAKNAQDINLLGTLGTAFTTAGKVDVKGADGDVFVRQATAANLNATVVGTVTSNQGTANATPWNENIAQINGVAPLMGNGTSGTGAQRVTIASDSTGQVAPAANATATGTSIYNNTALSSTKQAVNASAGNLYGYHIYNPNSVVIYVQLFNVASASVTVGSTAPTAVLAVPAGGWADAPPSGPPITFATALTIAATTTSTGSTAPTTALLCNMWYK